MIWQEESPKSVLRLPSGLAGGSHPPRIANPIGTNATQVGARMSFCNPCRKDFRNRGSYRTARSRILVFDYWRSIIERGQSLAAQWEAASPNSKFKSFWKGRQG